MSRVKKKADEDYTESDILKVISLLEAENPITKKDACSMLRIAYNPKRLGKIITEYQEEKARIAERKKALRTVPLSDSDETYIVSAYLEGIALDEISNTIYRGITVIKRVLNKYNIPLREAGVTYHNPVLLESEPAEDYVKGDLVFSARYNSPAEIFSEVASGIYRIWVYHDSKYAYQPYYELGDLRKAQKKLNINIETMSKDEITMLINEGLRNARKREKK